MAIAMSDDAKRRRRRILVRLLLVMAMMAAVASYEIMRAPDLDRLNFMHRFLVSRVVDKWQDKVKALPDDMKTIVEYRDLMSELNFVERQLVEMIFAINPRKFGFNGPYHSTKKPDNLVKVTPGYYKAGTMVTFTGKAQYCPRHSYEDYQRMMTAMKMDLGRVLFIESAYRSPGQQAFDFLFYLVANHDFSLYETARLSALPGYSEHHDPVNNSIDFINEDGVNDRSFELLPEYAWLQANAAKFNFYLSYPKHNELGVTFEPWHWHWEAPRK